MGKSKLLASLFVQNLNQGIASCLVDPHGDLAVETLALLLDAGFYRHTDAFKSLLYIDFGRRDRFVPFNVLAQPYDAHTVARNMVEVCKRAWPALGEGAAPAFENAMLAASYVLVENKLPITQLPRLLSNKEFRDSLLARTSDKEVVEFFEHRFDRWGKETSVNIESTLRRVFLLTFSGTLRYTLGQRRNVLDFRRFMDEGISVIVNLGGLDEETQRFLGCLITVGFEVAALSRADIPQSRRRPYHLILDEFSMFSAQSEEALSRMLSLTRKYGLYSTLAHQTFSQLSERLRGALQNCVDIAFRLGRNDAKSAAPRFGHFEPYLVKHEVADPFQVDRSHPVFFNLSEQQESWTHALQTLSPREAYVNLDGKTVKIRTLEVPPPKCSQQEVKEVMERYAELLMTPREQVLRELDPPAEKPKEHVVYRRVQAPAGQRGSWASATKGTGYKRAGS